MFAELGDRDRRYIVSMIEMHRRLVVAGRIMLFGSRNRAAWVAGTSMLALAKILENMEIGHNVMHGQWDWMNDPQINSATWDWDTASTAEAWKHSHNYVHHTYTNIRGKDRDLGYEIMRIDPHQKWHPVYLLQPFYNLVLAAFFEWGVAFHDLDFEAIKRGEKSKAAINRELKGMAQKAWLQVAKDYITFPALTAAINTGVTAGVRALQGRSKSRTPRRLYERVRPPRQQQSLLDVARESYTADAEGELLGEHHPQRLVLRDHLLRALPRPDLHVQPGRRSRTRPAARSTCASCSARRTSTGARSST